MVRWSVPREVNGDGRFLLRRRNIIPVYLKTYEEGRMRDKIEDQPAVYRDHMPGHSSRNESSRRYSPNGGFGAVG